MVFLDSKLNLEDVCVCWFWTRRESQIADQGLVSQIAFYLTNDQGETVLLTSSAIALKVRTL